MTDLVSQAQALAKATGARSVTVRNERRLPDGTLVVEGEATMPVPVYDPAADSRRVDEGVVRHLIATLPLRIGAVVVQGPRFIRGGVGSYAAIRCIIQHNGSAAPEGSYSTHTVIVRAESGEKPTLSAESGHYDLTFAEAMEDLGGL